MSNCRNITRHKSLWLKRSDEANGRPHSQKAPQCFKATTPSLKKHTNGFGWRVNTWFRFLNVLQRKTIKHKQLEYILVQSGRRELLTVLLILDPEELSELTQSCGPQNHLFTSFFWWWNKKNRGSDVRVFCKPCAANWQSYHTLTKYQHQTGSPRNKKKALKWI